MLANDDDDQQARDEERMRLAFHLAREYHRRGDWDALADELAQIDLGRSWLGREAAARIVRRGDAPRAGGIEGNAAFTPFDRNQMIAAPVDGRVKQTWVVEGSRVEAGDPLIEIVDNGPGIPGDDEFVSNLFSIHFSFPSFLISLQQDFQFLFP